MSEEVTVISIEEVLSERFTGGRLRDVMCVSEGDPENFVDKWTWFSSGDPEEDALISCLVSDEECARIFKLFSENPNWVMRVTEETYRMIVGGREYEIVFYPKAG